MKRFVSACIAAVMVLSMLAGCSSGGATMSSDLKKSTKAGMHTVSDEMRQSIKQAVFGENETQKAIKSLSEKLVKNQLFSYIKKSIGGAQSMEPSEVTQTSPYNRAKAVFEKLETDGDNVLYSPLSLEMALGLVSESAEGDTKSELLSVLGVDTSYSGVAEAVMARAGQITEEFMDDEGVTHKRQLKIANSLWVNDNYSVHPDFIGVAEKSYRATSESVNFADAEAAAKRINDWCKDATNGLIPGIVSEDMLSDLITAILCNSVYFESSWNDEWNVREGKFTNADGTVTELPDMLYDTLGAYYETENAVAFSKGYATGSTFVGILPKDGVSIADIDLDALMASRTYNYDVQVSMPKLNYDFKADNLVEVLQACGVNEVFTTNSQLTKLVNESEQVLISKILQKCKIELDENGTKAAAVTAIAMVDFAALPESKEVKEINLDRPFYFMIVDEPMNQVLFIGAVKSL